MIDTILVRILYSSVLIDSRVCKTLEEVIEIADYWGIYIDTDGLRGTVVLCYELYTPKKPFAVDSDKIRDGLEAARQRGIVLGPPIKVTTDQQVEAEALRAQGCSYRAIARTLGLSVGTVYTLVNMAACEKVLKKTAKKADALP